MKKSNRLLILFALFFAIASLPSSANDSVMSKKRYTYLIVHGATGGGWDWKSMDELLTSKGHRVYRPTLTGLGEKVHLANAGVNLTTHITDITNKILFDDLAELVLVGHSYGGMVVTGVMNQMPERIKHVVFLDAAVPKDGMSALELWGGLSPADKVVDGYVYFSWLDLEKPIPRDVPQSLKTLTELVSFNNPDAFKLSTTYIAFVPSGVTIKERSTDPSWQNAKVRGWTIRTLNSDHNAHRSHLQELGQLLEVSPEDRNQL